MSYFDEAPEQPIIRRSTPKARKQHICCQTGETINPGEVYTLLTVVCEEMGIMSLRYKGVR